MTTATPPTTVAESILADADRLGLRLWAAPGGTGKLRFRPRSAITADLATRIKAHREELLALLEDTTAEALPSVLWSAAELDLLAAAGTDPGGLPLVVAAKRALAPYGGGTVTSIQAAHGQGGWHRQQAARLVWDAKRTNGDFARDLRDSWGERVAICIVDAHLPESHAEKIALEQVAGIRADRKHRERTCIAPDSAL